MTKILLQSNDGEVLEVSRSVIRQSKALNTMFEDLGMDAPEAVESLTDPIPIQNVNAAILKKVIEWCELHKDDPDESETNEKRTDDIPIHDAEFLKIDQVTLFEIILAANYLDVKGLLDVACKAVANMIKGKSPEDIRRTFNIKNDFSPEDEELLRNEDAWIDE